MAENLSDYDIESIIPRMQNNQAISVGFETSDSIAVLKQMLISIFNPALDKSEKRENEQLKVSKEINKKLDDQNKNLKDLQKENKEYIKKLQSVSDETRKAIEEFKGYNVSFWDIASKSFTNYVQDTVKLANVYRDIESSGILIKQGFDSLGSTASSLGMTYEELAGHLKKSAPLIAKLNGSYKDGATLFKQSIQNISDDYNLTHNEQVAAFNAALENLTPSQLRNMSEQQLIAQVDETAKQMKMLSIATGKTVEQIKEENDLKAKSLRVEAWKRNNKMQAQILSMLGLDSDDMLDYILSGGTRVNGQLFTQIAGDSYLQAALPDIMNMIQNGQLNLEGVKYLQQQYGNKALERMNQVDRNANNRALQAGSSASAYFENYAFNDLASQNLMKFDYNKAQEWLESDQRRKDAELLSNYQRFGENERARDNEILRAKTGGTEGMNKSLSLLATVNGGIAKTLEKINNGLDSLGLSGMTTGMLANTISIAAPSLFAYSVSKFSKAVDRFAGGAFTGNGLLENMTSKDSFLGKAVRKSNNFASRLPYVGKFINTPMKGFGVGAGAAVLGSATDWANNKLVENNIIEKNGIANKALGYGSSMLSSAGNGAMIGSMFGPIGTLIGGGLGAAWGFYKQYQENKALEQAEIKPNEYSSISNKAVVNNTNNNYETNEYMKKMVEIQAETRDMIRRGNTITENAIRDNKLSGNQTPIIYSNAQEK